jgi:peptide deformylase
MLPVYLYNHQILKTKTEPVAEITDDVRQFIAGMFAAMHAADGIGLAGNQAGRSLSLAVIDISETDERNAPPQFVMINPKIVYYSEEETEMEEGCLSLPLFRETVTRPELVQVRYYDDNMKEHVREAGGLLARVMQHEIDHLNGIYFFERLSAIRRTLSQKKLRRIANGEIIPTYSCVDAHGVLYQSKQE